MILAVIIGVLSLLLDGLFSNYLPFMLGDLSLFTSFFSLVALIVVYPFFYHENKRYYLFCFLLGFCYDLFYTNLFFWNGFLFLFFALLIVKSSSLFSQNALTLLVYILGATILYETINISFLSLFRITTFSCNALLYKIIHSLLINLLYAEICYVIIHFLPDRYKRTKLN